jgi:PEP-CTERM motif
MLRALAAALIIATGVLIAPQPAHAIIVTLDDDTLSVVRPTSGTTRVDFTGNIDLTPGFEVSAVALSQLVNETGTSLALSAFPHFTFNATGVLFSLTVSATDALGTYAFYENPHRAATLTFYECPVGGGNCYGSALVHYSLQVLANAVPEPATLVLFGVGLLAVAAVRRRGYKAL